jgi:hypothetical protein
MTYDLEIEAAQNVVSKQQSNQFYWLGDDMLLWFPTGFPSRALLHSAKCRGRSKKVAGFGKLCR